MSANFRVATLTGGGDTQALNAILYGMALAVKNLGGELIGFRRGWAGPLYPDKEYLVHREEDGKPTTKKLEDITGEYVFLQPEMIDPCQGGSIIFSSRTDLRKIPGSLEDVAKRLLDLHIDYFIPIGGDDTNSVTLYALKNGVWRPVTVAVPKTIDNDVGPRLILAPDLPIIFENIIQIWNPGHPSANLKGRRFIEATYSTTHSHERVYWAEAMGRTAGWLTLSLAHLGLVHVAIVPEDPIHIEEECQRALDLYKKNGFFYGIVAEGAINAETGKPLASDPTIRDSFGHEKLGGAARVMAAATKRFFKVNGVRAPYFNAQIPEYMFRGGGPIKEDKEAAIDLGYHVIEKVTAGSANNGHMGVLRWNGLKAVPSTMPIEDAITITDNMKILPRTLPIDRQNPDRGFYDPSTKLPTELGRRYVNLFGIPSIKFKVWQGEVHK